MSDAKAKFKNRDWIVWIKKKEDLIRFENILIENGVEFSRGPCTPDHKIYKAFNIYPSNATSCVASFSIPSEEKEALDHILEKDLRVTAKEARDIAYGKCFPEEKGNLQQVYEHIRKAAENGWFRVEIYPSELTVSIRTRHVLEEQGFEVIYNHNFNNPHAVISWH